MNHGPEAFLAEHGVRIDPGPDPNGEALPIEATRMPWENPASLPTRQWLYPRVYVRKFMTATIAPSGAGKTGLIQVEALSMVSGRDLLHDGYKGPPLRVWLWNGEDPLDELKRQIYAAIQHYGLGREDIGGRLFLDSGRNQKINLARVIKNELKVDRPMVDAIIGTIRANRIDVALFDPFVTLHSAPENSNDSMDVIAALLAEVADATNSATGIVVHTRKPASGFNGPITSDDARGGGAIVAKARVARVLNRMTPAEAEAAGIEGKNAHRLYFRIGLDKASLTPPDEDDSWRHLKSVRLPNGETEFDGDSVRVVVRWNYPDALASVTPAHVEIMQRRIGEPPSAGDHWRENSQAEFWAGHLVGDVVGFTTTDTAGRKKASRILDAWIESGALKRCSLICADRKSHPCIAKGPKS